MRKSLRFDARSNIFREMYWYCKIVKVGPNQIATPTITPTIRPNELRDLGYYKSYKVGIKQILEILAHLNILSAKCDSFLTDMYWLRYLLIDLKISGPRPLTPINPKPLICVCFHMFKDFGKVFMWFCFVYTYLQNVQIGPFFK